jgi:hypothetical protein
MILRRIAVVLTLVFCSIASTPSSHAADDTAAKAIFPYLDDGTFVVARCDVDKVDLKQVEKFIGETATAMSQAMKLDAEGQARMDQQTAQVTQMATSWITGMNDAGVQSVYGLFLNANFLALRTDDPAFVIPMKGDVDAGGVGALMKQAVGGRSEWQQVGEGIVFARPELIVPVKAHVEGGIPATSIDLADLTAAFAGEGDAPIRIALLPGEKARAWIEENLPAIPEPLGGETAILSRGVKWASVTLVHKPEVIANVAIRCIDSEKAKAMMGVLESGLALVRKNAGRGAATVWAKELAAIQPVLKNETISFSVKPTTVMLAMVGLRMNGAPAPQAAPPFGEGNATDKDGL